jgi:hypothetical protein
MTADDSGQPYPLEISPVTTGTCTCRPVRERLVLLAAGKLAETRHSIAELRALEAGLTDLYQQLDAWRRSRHLRPGCGCPDSP